VTLRRCGLTDEQYAHAVMTSVQAISRPLPARRPQGRRREDRGDSDQVQSDRVGPDGDRVANTPTSERVRSPRGTGLVGSLDSATPARDARGNTLTWRRGRVASVSPVTWSVRRPGNGPATVRHGELVRCERESVRLTEADRPGAARGSGTSDLGTHRTRQDRRHVRTGLPPRSGVILRRERPGVPRQAAPLSRIEHPCLGDPHEEDHRLALTLHDVANGPDNDRGVAHSGDLRVLDLLGQTWYLSAFFRPGRGVLGPTRSPWRCVQQTHAGTTPPADSSLPPSTPPGMRR
jgi:hypothetical protein